MELLLQAALPHVASGMAFNVPYRLVHYHIYKEFSFKFLTGSIFFKIVVFRYSTVRVLDLLHISSDSNSSLATVSHRIGSSIPHEGPSRIRSRHRVRRDQHVEESNSDDAPTYIMLEHNPWEGIVSTVKQQVHLIKEKYYIPFEITACPYVALILRRLEICRMQLSPNSIRHIILFTIIMRVHQFEPNFDNFWTLYSFTTSARSADSGFFYLSARRDCRYLHPLTSNVGPWKERFIFIRPPPGREWPFKCELVLEKLKPVIERGGLEGDQINSLTSYRYDPKKNFGRGSPQARASLSCTHPNDMVTQACLTQRIHAAQARAAAESIAPPYATSSRPVADSSMAPEGSPPRNPLPIDIGSENTRSRGLLRDVSHEVLGLPNISRTDESSPGGLLGRRRRKDSAAIEERRNMEMLNDVTNYWHKVCEDLQTPNHLIAELNGEKLIPDWKVSSNSTVLGSQSGQETWELYNASCLPRDQATVLQTSFTCLEKHAAHSFIQATNFVHGLSLKWAGFCRNQIITERRNHDLQAKVLEASARGEDLENQRATLEARSKKLEVKMSSEISKATELGKEIGFVAGHAAGKIAGAIEPRIQGARDFIKAPAFEIALEINAADYLIEGFERCKAQVSTLNRFAPEFDETKLDPGLGGNMQLFPNEEAPPQVEDKFTVLLVEIENH
ncbi:UNVERIFIED_CONTAM: hypothetical protein Sindi_1323800 [Sesamum indicum]